MRTTTKTRLGFIAAGSGAVALAAAGFALPASADDQVTTTETSSSSTEAITDVTSSLDAFQTWLTEAIAANNNEVAPVTGVSPDTSVGDVSLIEGPLVGDIASGNQAPIASGNDTSAPIGSGNDTSVEAPIDAPVGSGNDVSAPVEVPVDAGNGNSAGNGTETNTGLGLGDIGADVDTLVEDVTSDLGLDNILG